MRKILVSVLLCLFCLQASAQTPEKISYQAVVRDNANLLVADKVVGMRISILQGSVTGASAYVERQSPRSNVNGLVTLEIGAGTVVSGSFVGLNWSSGPYFIQTEIDPSGGSNYSILGVSQLVSVPYALYAKTSGSSTPGPAGPAGTIGATGPIGPAGVAGAAGTNGPPGIQGAKGDTGDTGPIGPAGADGTNGTNGANGGVGSNGLDGKTVINGTSNPATDQGVIGDFYINTATSTLFGPKASGGWPTGVSLVGAAGIQGVPGAAGPAPTGTGIVTVSSNTLQTPSGLTGDVTTTGAGLATTIATGAVTSGKILDGTIATADLANSAVTDEKIAGVAGSKVSGNITGNAANVTGIVAVGNGGTGTTTLTANNVLLGNGTSALQSVAPGTNGNVLTSNGTTWTSVTPAAGLPSTGNTAGDMLYWNGSAWVKVAAGSNGQTLSIVGTTPMWQKPAIPSMGTTDVYNHKTGKVWMDRNLGASQVATSSTDAASYGDLYQWGRGADGHQLRDSPTTTTLSSLDQPGNGNFILVPNSPFNWRSPQNTNLWQGVNGINNPCPTGYRIPTEAEWDAERLSWSANTSIGAFASPLKLPMAGGRSNSSGSLSFFVGFIGNYWSSTVSSSDALLLFFSSNSAPMLPAVRAYGYSVRCIKD